MANIEKVMDDVAAGKFKAVKTLVKKQTLDDIRDIVHKVGVCFCPIPMNSGNFDFASDINLDVTTTDDGDQLHYVNIWKLKPDSEAPFSDLGLEYKPSLDETRNKSLLADLMITYIGERDIDDHRIHYHPTVSSNFKKVKVKHSYAFKMKEQHKEMMSAFRLMFGMGPSSDKISKKMKKKAKVRDKYVTIKNFVAFNNDPLVLFALMDMPAKDESGAFHARIQIACISEMPEKIARVYQVMLINHNERLGDDWLQPYLIYPKYLFTNHGETTDGTIKT